ncbi:MAG: FimV/HubP family polar landmark protein [Pseudomonadota bacterium]|nr:FimV/HubP family polar landmark protein [Pseudomonadota bacterium]
MKVRKLAVALALAGGLGSSVAQALGLGEIELQSYLNEPLDAEITLPQSRGVNPSDVFVNIAPESAYERVGLSRNQFLSKLRFQVVTQNDGSLAVNVSSREPLREPYLNFLLELTWPSGRLMREYAVLVDPPVYAEDSGVQEQVAAPTTSAAPSQPAPARSAESVRRQTQAEQSLSRGYEGETLGPTGASDTLWTIASRVRPNDGVSTQQVMLAIQDLNPDAFIDGNINRLKRGEILRVPSLEQVQSRTRAEATRAVSQQNTEFQSPRRTVDATASQPAQPAPQQAGTGGDELKLLVADNDSRETTEGGSAGGDADLPGGVDAGSAAAMEELERARRENDELNTRVEDLQDQVQTLQRLLELKNSQLADMQQRAGEESEVAGAPETGTGSDANAPAGEPAQADAAADADDVSGAEGTGAAVSAEAQDATASDQAEAVTDGEAGTDAVAGEESATGEDVAESEQAATSATAEADASATAAPEASQASEAAAPAAEPEVQPAQSVAQETAADKPFPGNVIDAIKQNLIYQIALGGGLILLLLLLLVIARRNANREKAFYDQLNSESGDENDSFALSLDDDEAEPAAGQDPIAEADTYIAYGRHEQAAQTLENAISREPSRTDLRLKLLAVYADSQDRASFDKQFGELEALDDDEATASAMALRSQLDEAESMPSIDDLESQLRSDSFGGAEVSEMATEAAEQEDDELQLSDELLADQYDAQKEEQVENEFGELDSDFADFDLNEVESAEESATASVDEAEEAPKDKSADDLIEYDLSDISTGSDEDAAEESADDAEVASLESNDDYSALEIEFDEPADRTEQPEAAADELDLDLELDSALEEELEAESTSPAPTNEAADAEEQVADEDMDSLDESFLDELDAELDKVADEDGELGGEEIEESTLDDLELDVSDEDLALMEEFSDSADSANSEAEPAQALDDDLDLEDALGDDDTLGNLEADSPEAEVAGTEELEDLEELEGLAPADELEESEVVSESDPETELPVASEKVGEDADMAETVDIDENELGDDDDFDFLAGTDEAATKLDLARAYIEMGDSDGARDILEEVALEGDSDQKTEAQELLKNLA